MERLKKNMKDVRFRSEKNGNSVMSVHNDLSRMYARYVEDMDAVESYEVCVPLDTSLLNNIPKVDIRGEYFTIEWATDFLLTFRDGSHGVVEVVYSDDLYKQNICEQLELSRRYWQAQGIYYWKVATIE